MAEFHAQDGARIAYDDTGPRDGLPVLALAGLTRDARDFDFLRPHLPEDVRFIAMDYRGRGRSEFTGADTYTLAQEGQDALALLDHLGIARAAILGTSRGGLIAMGLAAGARDRLTGICLNDIGPEIDPAGLEFIKDYLGKPPVWKTLEEAAVARSRGMPGFRDVPMSRWREEAARLFRETPDGLALTYDPALAEAVAKAGAQQVPDLWPYFDAMQGLPLAAIRGQGSDLLSAETFARMKARRPDMIAAEVPGRGHIPFLDEPEALAAIHKWLENLR